VKLCCVLLAFLLAIAAASLDLSMEKEMEQLMALIAMMANLVNQHFLRKDRFKTF